MKTSDVKIGMLVKSDGGSLWKVRKIEAGVVYYRGSGTGYGGQMPIGKFARVCEPSAPRPSKGKGPKLYAVDRRAGVTKANVA